MATKPFGDIRYRYQGLSATSGADALDPADSSLGRPPGVAAVGDAGARQRHTPRHRPAAGAWRPSRGVLIVGMGDENRGDGGVGLHLMECLQQLDWPGDVAFCQAHASLPRQAEQFARVILLDAIEGPEEPGSLYQANPEDLLACAGPPGRATGLVGMLTPAVRKRLAIFAMHPRNLGWGSELSSEVVRAISLALPYLRSFILQMLRTLASLQ